MPDGYLTTVKKALQAPSENMTWTQLALATGFVLIVAIAWRQVTLMIMREL
jgi:hypothetical protein